MYSVLKDNFPNAVREKFPSQNAIEKKIQITIMDMVVAIKQVKLAAAREIAGKYGVNSEDDIDGLEKRLKLLPDKIAGLKREISYEQLKLKRVSDLICAYEKIVEGNYIDNLIKARNGQNAEIGKTDIQKQMIKS